MKPIKILVVINSLTAGGAEKLVVETSKRFAERGYIVDVLLLEYKKDHLNNIVEDVENLNVIRFDKEISLYSPKNIILIRKHLKKNSYDIINVHLFPSLYWAAFGKIGLNHKAKLIYTEHNTHNRRRNSWFFKLLDKFIYPKCDMIIAISEIANRNLKAHLASEKTSIRTINNGINLTAIQNGVGYTKQELGYSEKNILLLQVSNFRQQKDQKTLIRSLKHLPDHIHLLLVGDGPLKLDCKETAKNLGVLERVNFLGLRNDVPRLLKSVDIVILSSHHEGLSLSSVEGMASGKPFIASNVEGLKEVVAGAGVLFPESDDIALSKSILELLEDEVFRDKVIEKCLERAEQYDIEIMVDSYIALYKEALTEHEKTH